MKKYVLSIFVMVVMVLVVNSSVVYAAAVTFFGEDLGSGENVRLASHPNSDAARTNFFANLVGVGTENFEGFANGTGIPIVANFGSSTATLTSANSSNGFVNAVSTGTNGYGRYPISGNNYFDTSSSVLMLTFSTPQSAFGFYGIDVGDFEGQLTLNYGGPAPLTINHVVNGAGGSVLYYGFYDLDNPFTSITFGNTAAGTDVFAFDDFSIGTREQIKPNGEIPEPASMSLLGVGLLSLLGFRKRA